MPSKDGLRLPSELIKSAVTCFPQTAKCCLKTIKLSPYGPPMQTNCLDGQHRSSVCRYESVYIICSTVTIVVQSDCHWSVARRGKSTLARWGTSLLKVDFKDRGYSSYLHGRPRTMWVLERHQGVFGEDLAGTLGARQCLVLMLSGSCPTHSSSYYPHLHTNLYAFHSPSSTTTTSTTTTTTTSPSLPPRPYEHHEASHLLLPFCSDFLVFATEGVFARAVQLLQDLRTEVKDARYFFIGSQGQVQDPHRILMLSS